MTEETKTSTKYVMVESGRSVDEDEIDLLELIRTLLQAWKTIIGITIVCVGLAVAYAFHAPEVFKAETLLAPAFEEKSVASSALETIWWFGRDDRSFHTQRFQCRAGCGYFAFQKIYSSVHRW